MRFAFIAEHRETWPVKTLCKVLGVSRQGFYEFVSEPVSKRESANSELDVVVHEVFHEHAGRYGSPRVHQSLVRERELHIGKRRVEASMARQGLFAYKPKKFVVTTRADETYAHPANTLARDFVAVRPDVRWVTDITYLWSPDGWVYLAAIIDLFSRKVIGWSLSRTIDTALALQALEMALAQREGNHALLHHSDRGCQYTSDAYTAKLHEENITVSMSRRGDCWDNAVAESFFATLKKELVYRKTWHSAAELERAVFEYIETYYNPRRLHSSLGYRTPNQAEDDFLNNRHAA